jgi:hypothetical protein
MPIRTWTAPHDLPESHYINPDANPSRLYVTPYAAASFHSIAPPPSSSSSRPSACTIRRDGTPQEPRLSKTCTGEGRSDFWSGYTRLLASSDNEFPNDNFFSAVDNLFSNLNMGDNTGVVAASTNASTVQVRSYVFQSFLEFTVLIYVVEAIGLSYLDVFCSSILLVCMINILVVYVVVIYHLFIRIKSYSNLLIYSTIQKSDYRQRNSSGAAAATRPP